MVDAILARRRSAADPHRRGYGPTYRDGGANHCPGCGGANWIVGRLTAECGFCGTALPLADSVESGGRVPWTRGNRNG